VKDETPENFSRSLVGEEKEGDMSKESFVYHMKKRKAKVKGRKHRVKALEKKLYSHPYLDNKNI